MPTISPTRPADSAIVYAFCTHWHLYWTAAGQAPPAIKWIMPVFVGGNKLRMTTSNIIKE